MWILVLHTESIALGYLILIKEAILAGETYLCDKIFQRKLQLTLLKGL